MQQYFKRDIQIVADQTIAARKSAENLNKLAPHRLLSIAITRLEEAELWLDKMKAATPESEG